MDFIRRMGVIFTLLLICICIGACSAEEIPGYLTYLQGGASSIAEGANGTMALTIADVIPYYGMDVVNRTILMPLEPTSPYDLPLNAALVLNGADGESVYLVTIQKWSFDKAKNILTFDIKPLEFYEGKELKKFTGVKQGLAPDKVGKELSTGIYIEITGNTPENAIPLGYCDTPAGAGSKVCGLMVRPDPGYAPYSDPE